MASNDYHFFTRWRVQGTTVEEVATIIGDAAGLVRWWPSVYLDVQVLEPGDAQGLGKVVSLYTKGWLPYTLRWQFRVSEVRPDGFALKAWGDFDGWGNWTFTQQGEDVSITYEWSVRADKPLLRSLSFLIKPIFAANHHWAMAQGEISLKLELARRHAPTAEEREQVALPPGPTRVAWLPLLLGIAVVAGTIYGLARRRQG